MDSPHGAAVKAEDFGLKGPRGWAFRGIGLDAAPGSLIAVEGPSGSGRTCLLLALTGRMKPTEGHAEIGRHRLPKKMAAVRRIAALGPVPGVNDLDQSLTVAEQLREGALLQRHYGAPIRSLFRSRAERRATAAARIDAALDAAGLDLATLPKGERTTVRDLERLEAVRLSVAIALLGSPQLLALDDLDIKLSDTERTEVWALLRSIAARGITVLAVCSEAPADAVVLRTGPKEDGAGAGRDADADAKAEAEPAAKAEAEPAVEKDSGAKKDAETGPATATATENDADDTGNDGNDDNDDDDTKGADDALAEAGRA
ncbi:ATP-binding cassette domain-containing protein [Streptomyces erythrochromogenes]|uniref:ATP-binding cassette domain-containing protein n=1 Tax=Streptomyces erythrochromogenes TaxID=285574 RepID=UPI0022532629|nr:ATP-binding cassette domain-containing protein [Streptomyces erythrochromogenes]MCX5587258.1 ATP-binding cassette domain-containing protein [Streptomyces erythrochromogenes]